MSSFVETTEEEEEEEEKKTTKKCRTLMDKSQNIKYRKGTRTKKMPPVVQSRG